MPPVLMGAVSGAGSGQKACGCAVVGVSMERTMRARRRVHLGVVMRRGVHLDEVLERKMILCAPCGRAEARCAIRDDGQRRGWVVEMMTSQAERLVVRLLQGGRALAGETSQVARPEQPYPVYGGQQVRQSGWGKRWEDGSVGDPVLPQMSKSTFSVDKAPQRRCCRYLSLKMNRTLLEEKG